MVFATALENRLQDLRNKAKKPKQGEQRANQEMLKWLNSDKPDQTSGRFKDPMA